MSSSPDESKRSRDLPSLGLSGIWATVANFSAVVILCGVFILQNMEMMRVAAEDRAMCRAQNREQWIAVKEGQEAILRLTRSVEEIGVEVRALREKSQPK